VSIQAGILRFGKVRGLGLSVPELGDILGDHKTQDVDLFTKINLIPRRKLNSQGDVMLMPDHLKARVLVVREQLGLELPPASRPIKARIMNDKVTHYRPRRCEQLTRGTNCARWGSSISCKPSPPNNRYIIAVKLIDRTA